MTSLRIIPPPDTIPDGTSPYIAESIRRTRLENEQHRILMEVCNELNIDPRLERRARRRAARTYTRDARRRLKQGQLGRFSREQVIERDRKTCYMCGKVCARSEIHLDHVIPLSKGGDHTLENIKVSCADCNLRKGNGTIIST